MRKWSGNSTSASVLERNLELNTCGRCFDDYKRRPWYTVVSHFQGTEAPASMNVTLFFTCFFFSVICQAQSGHVVLISGIAGHASHHNQSIVIGLAVRNQPPVAGRAQSLIVYRDKPWCVPDELGIPDSLECSDLVWQVTDVRGNHVGSITGAMHSQEGICLSPLTSLAAGRYIIHTESAAGWVWHCLILLLDSG